jgi:hypothetical protein
MLGLSSENLVENAGGIRAEMTRGLTVIEFENKDQGF